MAYSIHCQRDRRNLTDADLLRWTAELDKRQSHGGDRRSEAAQEIKAPDGAMKKSAERTAETLGVSPRKVERIRTVLDHAAPEVKAQVLSGKKTINKAYTETQAKKKPENSA